MPVYFDWSRGVDKKELRICSDIILDDGLVILPTETVYGIGSNALSSSAVRNIYNAKRRPINKPLSIIVANKKQIEDYAIIQNDVERKIIDNFMPGPLTIILKKNNNIPNIVTAGNDTIGIRIPANKICTKLLNECGVPLVASSANISGEPCGTNIRILKKDFERTVDIFINGGPSKLGQPSTIVQVIDGELNILREGQITKEDIEKIIK